MVTRLGVAGRLLQFRECFLFHPHDRHVVTEAACPLQGEKRESTVTGDDAYSGQGSGGPRGALRRLKSGKVECIRSAVDDIRAGRNRARRTDNGMRRISHAAVALMAALWLAGCDNELENLPTPPDPVTVTEELRVTPDTMASASPISTRTRDRAART